MKTTENNTASITQATRATSTTATEQKQQHLPFPASLDPRSPMNRNQVKSNGHASPHVQAPGLLASDRGAWWHQQKSGHYRIFVQMPGNQPNHLIEVATTWTIGVLKSKLQDLHGMPADDIRLMVGGQELTNAQMTLDMCGVNEFTTVQCLYRLHGGAKAKSKGGKSFKKGKKTEQKTELIFKEPDQEYAQVTALLGSSRLRVRCGDGAERLCTIRGKLVRRAWVNVGTVILVSLRDFEQGKCDMIHRYSDDEARRLRAYDELPHEMKLISDEANGCEGGEGGDDGIVFDFDLDTGDIDIDSI